MSQAEIQLQTHVPVVGTPLVGMGQSKSKSRSKSKSKSKTKSKSYSLKEDGTALEELIVVEGNASSIEPEVAPVIIHPEGVGDGEAVVDHLKDESSVHTTEEVVTTAVVITKDGSHSKSSSSSPDSRNEVVVLVGELAISNESRGVSGSSRTPQEPIVVTLDGTAVHHSHTTSKGSSSSSSTSSSSTSSKMSDIPQVSSRHYHIRRKHRGEPVRVYLEHHSEDLSITVTDSASSTVTDDPLGPSYSRECMREHRLSEDTEELIERLKRRKQRRKYRDAETQVSKDMTRMVESRDVGSHGRTRPSSQFSDNKSKTLIREVVDSMIDVIIGDSEQEEAFPLKIESRHSRSVDPSSSISSKSLNMQQLDTCTTTTTDSTDNRSTTKSHLTSLPTPNSSSSAKKDQSLMDRRDKARKRESNPFFSCLYYAGAY